MCALTRLPYHIGSRSRSRLARGKVPFADQGTRRCYAPQLARHPAALGSFRPTTATLPSSPSSSAFANFSPIPLVPYPILFVSSHPLGSAIANNKQDDDDASTLLRTQSPPPHLLIRPNSESPPGRMREKASILTAQDCAFYTGQVVVVRRRASLVALP
ncbi:uncharacterized protein LY79DRAFT_108746 [Colletotrichum navitas]|uniref:Uncharacterized protein n=1 Tax=Colletotrichum navitas TaxID=681940 RepID=A0AAD8Q4W2_9PEZI|nr:uncharacterized protein LY79DRAFT_108746 [Colletotrichum navitas]KAK1595286.1 hypothetical protein LY79DRAFT_108746 [Colletotrichum navitas]